MSPSPESFSWTTEDRELVDLLISRTPLIDVRAPVEFVHGSIPGAINLPLLDNDQRAAVGTAYKETGPEAAFELGMSLISGDTKAHRLQAWQQYIETHPNAYLYCFRGGLRSRSVRDVLSREYDLKVPLINGGYKRVRQFLLNSLERLSPTTDLSVVTGFTGAGKTIFLKALAKSHKVCDLEGLAKHRGSAFGKLVAPQPSQADFENLLALNLIESTLGANSTLWIEDESRMIGKVVVPDTLFANLSKAPLYVIEKPVTERARALIGEYLTENYGLGPEDTRPDPIAMEKFRFETEHYLALISRRLGGAEYKTISALFKEAFEEHSGNGGFECHLPWVEKLLEKYYDPVYLRHLEREKHRVVFTGSVDELNSRLRKNTPSLTIAG